MNKWTNGQIDCLHNRSLHTTSVNPFVHSILFSTLISSEKQTMTTIAIKYCDIPAFLHKGEFYRSLDSNDPDGIIEIPRDCFAPSMIAKPNLEQFSQLIRIMIFWMLDEIPVGVLHFCSRNNVDIWRNATRDLPEDTDIEANILSPLLTAYSDQDSVPLMKIIQCGKWEVIKHTVCRMNKNTYATALAAEAGNLSLLRLLHEEGFLWHKDTCYQAALKGQLECLQYAYANGCPMNSDVFLPAAARGHVLCMKFAHINGVVWHPETCMHAAFMGYLACLTYAHEHGSLWDSSTVISAAQNGHIDCLQYALDHDCPHSLVEATKNACMHGRLSCLQLLHQRGAAFTEETAFHAAKCPDSACLEYLRQFSCPWDARTTSESARTGCVYPLKFALENGCPHEDELMCIAAGSGSVDCLQYLVEMQGLYMDEDVFIAALLKGNMQCLQYVIDQACPYLTARFNKTNYGWYDTIYVRNNDSFLLCVEYAVERGWSLDKPFIDYLSSRDFHHCQKLIGRASRVWLFRIMSSIMVLLVYMISLTAYFVFFGHVKDPRDIATVLGLGLCFGVLFNLFLLFLWWAYVVGKKSIVKYMRRTIPNWLPVTR